MVITYAPIGLGHIRVANALISGIPEGLEYEVFAPSDNLTESMYRFSSLNVPARRVMEFFQRGLAESLYTKLFTKRLKSHTGDIFEQFIQVIGSRKTKPDRIIIVSTHFGLAYQLGALRTRLEKVLGIEIRLVVQVTDDSPQVAWYVDVVDLIICPSQQTKKLLQEYADKNKLRKVEIRVTPYPVDLNLAKILTREKVENRRSQYDSGKSTPINIVIPVSGAAVGMEFFLHLMRWLHAKSPRFVFHVVCRRAPFTKRFLEKIKHRSYARLYVSHDSKEVVEMYRNVYLDNVISAEVTKPSEQAFKALLRNDSAGGSFLLFAEPVGRQEHDNIDFLKRHGFLSAGPNLRGYILPFGSQASAELIWELFNYGRMLKAFDDFTPKESNHEVGDAGVAMFWKIVLNLL